MNNKRSYISEAFCGKFGYTEQKIDTDRGPTFKMVLEGEFQRAEEPNRNKRVYPLRLLERETKQLQNFINEHGGLPCGMDHPISSDTPEAMQLTQRIGLENSCALCTVLEMHGKTVYGSTEVLTGDNGTGDKLAAFVRKGFKPGVSSRGMGGQPVYDPSTGYMMVPEDYTMICYDFVSNPSVFNSILQQRLHEEFSLFESQYKKSHGRKFFDVLIELANKR